MGAFILQAIMNRGELSPYLHARGDTDHYAAGLEIARNVIPLRYGGVTRVPGTYYSGTTKSQVLADETRLLPFKFNRNQVYAIEAGDQYFRFWLRDTAGAPASQIESGGSPVEVATPYRTADLPNIKTQQSADVLYITCKGYAPRTLTRNSETSWSLAIHATEDGPFLPINTTGTALTPANYGSVVPTMTSNTLPSGTAASSSASANAYLVFDRDPTTFYQHGATSGYIDFTPAGAARVVDGYTIQASIAGATRTPDHWRVQGYTGSVWVTLDTRIEEQGWALGEYRHYTFVNTVAYQAYRFQWYTVEEGTGTTVTDITTLDFHERGENQTAFNLTASALDGINDGQGFLSTDVGRLIRFFGSDAAWRWFKIVARTSATVVTVQVYGSVLIGLDATTQWRMGSWSDESGWPRVVGNYEDRLTLAGTDDEPVAVWTSRNADYDSHTVSDPVVADDAIAARLTGGSLNEIGWMVVGRDILLGTPESIRALGRNDASKVFAPDNTRQRAETFVPTSEADPVQMEDVIVVIDYGTTALHEVAFTYEVDGYRARELSTLNEHLFAPGCKDIVFQRTPHRLLWTRRSDGLLAPSVYDRDQKVFGSSLVDYGGVVESTLALPGVSAAGADDLFLIVRRVVNGQTVRYVEVQAEFWRSDIHTTPPVYASAAAVYDGVATNTVTGLGHLEAETIGIWADGLDLGDTTVASGSVSLPNGIEAEQIVIGKRLAWTAKTLRALQWGQRDGSGLGRAVNITTALLDLFEAAGVDVAAAGGASPLAFEDDIEYVPFTEVELRTGSFPMPVDDSWRGNGQLTISGNKMYPATVRSLTLELEGEP